MCDKSLEASSRFPSVNAVAEANYFTEILEHKTIRILNKK